MSAGGWTLVITGVSVAAAGISYTIRTLLNFRGKWDEVNASIADMRTHQVRLERQLERHLDWHDRPRG